MATFNQGHALVVGVGADLPSTVDDDADLVEEGALWRQAILLAVGRLV